MLALTVNRLFLPGAPRDVEAEEKAAAQIAAPISVLDGVLARSDYLLGERFTAADLNVAAVLLNLHLADTGLEGAPRVAAWLAACLGRPAALATLRKPTDAEDWAR